MPFSTRNKSNFSLSFCGIGLTFESFSNGLQKLAICTFSRLGGLIPVSVSFIFLRKLQWVVNLRNKVIFVGCDISKPPIFGWQRLFNHHWSISASVDDLHISYTWSPTYIARFSSSHALYRLAMKWFFRPGKSHTDPITTGSIRLIGLWQGRLPH